jgi:integrase
MAKGSRGGWKLQKDRRTGIWFVRFRHAGERFNRSTRTKVQGEAQEEARRIYQRETSRDPVKRVRGVPELGALVEQWLEAHAAGRAPETVDMHSLHMSAHIVPHFGRLVRIDRPGLAKYVARRLREVSAKTVRNELSTIRQFLAWCLDCGVLDEAPAVPTIPKRALGTPVTKGAKVKVTLTRKQMEAVIAAVPEYTRRRKGHSDGPKTPARAAVVVLVETGIRRATLWRLRAPEHYHVGARHLSITKDIDKARDGRPLPLSDRARAALDSVCPASGLIFGRVDIRYQLAQASKGIGLPPHLDGRVSYHDLRRSFLTDLAESGASLGGMQYLAGHKHASTTSRYINPAMEAAEKALATRLNGTPSGTPKKRRAKKKPGKKRKSTKK